MTTQYVDIKRLNNTIGFFTYPNAEPLDYVEGFVIKADYKTTGTFKQLKVHIFNDGLETVLNVPTNTVVHDDLVCNLIVQSGKKIQIRIVPQNIIDDITKVEKTYAKVNIKQIV